MNSTLDSAFRKTARCFNISPQLVETIYSSYWKFIRDVVSQKPLKEIDGEEFDSSTMNVNIPYLGKLYADKDKFNRYKRQLKFYRDVKCKENKANGKQGSCD